MKYIPNVITSKVARQILVTQKHSPRLLFAVGIGGVVTSTVLACRSTLKLSDTLAEMRDNLDAVNHPNFAESSDHGRLVAYCYVTGTYKLIKLYAPAVIVGGLAITALTTSHVVLSRRNAGLTAAYALVSKAYEDYRDRVRDTYGEEVERDLYHATHTEKVKVEGQKEKELVKFADPNKFSPYARIFEAGSPNWQKDAELNRLFIQCQQKFANDLLQARGHIFLNEVYDMIGIDRSSAGAVVGWVISEEGDNYIDFGMFEAANAQFVNGFEPNIVLDFNVDGVIYDKIG